MAFEELLHYDLFNKQNQYITSTALFYKHILYARLEATNCKKTLQ